MYGDGWLIAFIEGDQRLALFEGPTAHYHSPVKAMNDWFHFQPRYVAHEGGKKVILEEAPGWFERSLRNAGCDWFLPIAKRIALGERVPVKELLTVFSNNNGGREMPHGSINFLFREAKLSGAWESPTQ